MNQMNQKVEWIAEIFFALLPTLARFAVELIGLLFLKQSIPWEDIFGGTEIYVFSYLLLGTTTLVLFKKVSEENSRIHLRDFGPALWVFAIIPGSLLFMVLMIISGLGLKSIISGIIIAGGMLIYGTVIRYAYIWKQ